MKFTMWMVENSDSVNESQWIMNFKKTIKIGPIHPVIQEYELWHAHNDDLTCQNLENRFYGCLKIKSQTKFQEFLWFIFQGWKPLIFWVEVQ